MAGMPHVRPEGAEKMWGPERPTGFTVVSVCWGREHGERLLRYGLPSLLSEGNLPAAYGNTELLLYLDEEVRDLFLNSEVYKYVRERTDITVIVERIRRPAKGDEKYQYWNRFIAKAVNRCYELNRIVIFAGSDVIFSDGVICHCVERIKGGARTVLSMGYAVSEIALEQYARRWASGAGAPMRVPQLEAAECVARNLSSRYQNAIIGSTSPLRHVDSTFIWPMGNDAYVFTCLDLNPICVWPRVKPRPIFPTYDKFLLSAAGLKWRDISIIGDATEGLVFSIDDAPPLHTDIGVTDRESMTKLARQLGFRFHKIGSLRRFVGRQQIVLRPSPDVAVGAEAQLLEQEIDAFMRQFYGECTKSSTRILLENWSLAWSGDEFRRLRKVRWWAKRLRRGEAEVEADSQASVARWLAGLYRRSLLLLDFQIVRVLINGGAHFRGMRSRRRVRRISRH